ncbi:hypothetical protein [uncultured Friedmanniella sp.]|uniref:hypothetical protein n=1 Tax=uncultured Friedmanniella sp. TaxID=335381 RepID=UPI0035CC4E24
MTTSNWFRVESTPDDHKIAFLRTLRAAAEQWTFDGLGPETTSTDVEFPDGRLVVSIEVPGLTSRPQHLQVCYRADVEGRPVLQSAWSRYARFDDPYEPPDEETELWVSGVDATPEQCSLWAAAWFERQLSRRVVRREWDRPEAGLSTLLLAADSGPVFVEWTIEAPDGVIDSRGRFVWSWLTGRPPSRTVVERPGVATQG